MRKQGRGGGSAQQKRVIRVLCLHGYGQSAAWMEKHLCELLTQCKGIKFIFPQSTNVDTDRMRSYCWWRRMNVAGRTQYSGVDAAISQIREVFARDGPFDGVLGLSQGACLVGLLCGIRSQDRLNPLPEGRTPIDFEWAVMCSGHMSHDSRHALLYQDGCRTKPTLCQACGASLKSPPPVTCTRCGAAEYCSRACAKQHWTTGGHSKTCDAMEARRHNEHSSSSKLSISSLHTISAADVVVPRQQSEALAKCFQHPEIVYHPEGHCVPQGEALQEIVRFISEHIQS